MTYLVLRLIFFFRQRWELVRVALGKTYRPILDGTPPSPPTRALVYQTDPAPPRVERKRLPVDDDPFFPEIHRKIDGQLRDTEEMIVQAKALRMDDTLYKLNEIRDGILNSRQKAYRMYWDRRRREERIAELEDRLEYLNRIKRMNDTYLNPGPTIISSSVTWTDPTGDIGRLVPAYDWDSLHAGKWR